jgi:hypothetical protein
MLKSVAMRVLILKIFLFWFVNIFIFMMINIKNIFMMINIKNIIICITNIFVFIIINIINIIIKKFWKYIIHFEKQS